MDTPAWIFPALTLIGAIIGGYAGAKVRMALMERDIKQVVDWMPHAQKELAAHGEDLLVHDFELQTLCAKTQTPRMSRQILRGKE